MTTSRRDSELNSDHHSIEEPGHPYETTLISFVVPFRNAEDTLAPLYGKIAANIPVGYDFEVIFVNDGSDDDSWNSVEILADAYYTRVRGIRFRTHVGKAAALTAGFRAARGEIVFTLNADMQDGPTEIPRFLDRLAEGHDVVSGHKKNQPNAWHKVIPNRIYNYLLNVAGCVKLREHSGGLKCYRAEVVKQLTLYGEMHRIAPSCASVNGFSVSDIEFSESAGQSPKGNISAKVGRFIAGVSDVLTIGFLRRFRERPSHFINGVAFVYVKIAAILLVSAFAVGVTSMYGILLGLVTLIFGGMAGGVFLCGLISEQVVRGGNESNWRLPIIEDTAAGQLDWARVPVPCEYVAAV